MTNPLTERTLETLELMRRSEECVAAFYAACAKRWKHDADFWNTLVEAEHMHASKLEAIAELVKANPMQYVAQRPFNPVATGLFIEWTEKSQKQIESGDCFKRDALILAMDMEGSLLENRFTDFLKTQDREYLLMVQTLQQETEAHIQMLKEKAAEHSVG
ncbi:hypothetical protein ACFL01_00015 [Planctomycetota bacterium]